MKEFVKKLIARLEERKEFHSRLIAYEQKNGTITEEYQHRKAVDVLDNAIEIINQLAEECNPKTRADKIRSMSDEELAIYLVNFKNTFGEEYEGEQSCLDWLKSEIKEV